MIVEDRPSYISKISQKVTPRHTLILFALLAAIFHFVLYLVFPNEPSFEISPSNEDNLTPNFAKQIPFDNRTKILYVFIAVGTNSETNKLIKNNIDHLVMKNQKDDKYKVDCLIFGYAQNIATPGWVRDIERDNNSPCRYIKIFHARFVKFFTHVPAYFLDRSGYSYVSFVLDDVIHYPPQSNFDFRTYFDIILQNDLEFISPSITNTTYDETPHAVGRIVKSIEVKAVTFKISAWSCFNELFDNEFHSGFEIEALFYNYCVIDQKAVKKEKIAIIDKYFVYHNPVGWTSLHEVGNVDAQIESWKLYRGIELTHTDADDQGIINYYD
jgi:hypothetical protein